MTITEKQFTTITINLGIEPVRAEPMSPFGASCYNDMEFDDLLTAEGRPADRDECEKWGISTNEWHGGIKEALAGLAADYLDTLKPAGIDAIARKAYVFAALDCDLEGMGHEAYRDVTAASLAQTLWDFDEVPEEITSAAEMEADVGEWLARYARRKEHYAICENYDPDAVLQRAPDVRSMLVAFRPFHPDIEKRGIGIRAIEADGRWSWFGGGSRREPTPADMRYRGA